MNRLCEPVRRLMGLKALRRLSLVEPRGGPISLEKSVPYGPSHAPCVTAVCSTHWPRSIAELRRDFAVANVAMNACVIRRSSNDTIIMASTFPPGAFLSCEQFSLPLLRSLTSWPYTVCLEGQMIGFICLIAR